MASYKDWIQAFRLRTLPLAISSILVGSGLAHYYGSFNLKVGLLAIVTAVLLQILSNLSNDLGDHQHGTDNAERLGPTRAMMHGRISSRSMKRAMIIAGFLALISGLWLIVEALGISYTSLGFLILGLASIYAAVRYTYGRNPYGYAGFGDFSVFIFFGLVGVAGTFYLHVGDLRTESVLFGCVFGLLSTAVLNLNNMRDSKNDRAMGKRTMAVLLGDGYSKVYHSALVLLAIVLTPVTLLVAAFEFDLMTSLICAIPLLLLVIVWLGSLRTSGSDLDRFLPAQAMSTFLLALLLTYILIRN